MIKFTGIKQSHNFEYLLFKIEYYLGFVFYNRIGIFLLFKYSFT